MDEVKHIEQTSISNNINNDENNKMESRALPLDKRICIVGSLVNNPVICSAAQSFGVSIVTSKTGLEYAKDNTCSTIFIIETFDGEIYDSLYKSKHPILGPPAIQQLANKSEKLPNNIRPLYNLAMLGVVVCFTGFRNKEDLARLVPLIHNMGGSIRREMSAKVTHLIANVSGSNKYQYATTFRVPVMHLNWVLNGWENRNDLTFTATLDAFVTEHKLKPFHGSKVCFLGFPEEEEKHMTEVLECNGGSVTVSDDPSCTHVVMDHAETYTLEANSGSHTPKSDTSIISYNPYLSTNNNPQTPYPMETLYEKSNDDLLFNDTITSNSNTMDKTSSSKRKRKFASPNNSFAATSNNKRRRDMCYSENSKRKFSDIFRTPIQFFGNRRRTISDLNESKNINDSVISSSGLFDVSIIENLNDLTPDKKEVNTRKIRKNLFTRTFSSSKFGKKSTKSRKLLNVTKLSLDDDSEIVDSGERLNVSCFPELSSSHHHSNDVCETQLCSNWKKEFGHPLTHAVVVDESTVTERPEVTTKAHVVKAEWFWTSVQKEICLDEKEYLFEDYIEHILSPNTRRDSQQPTTSSASRRKRKRIHDTLSSLTHQQSPGLHNKRRSSISDAGLLSVSGSFLDCTASPDKALLDAAESNTIIDTPRKGLTARQQVFLELVQTESNYVNILNTINTMFKKHLEEMPEQEALLNNTELKIIFGNLPPIYETHLKMLEELRWMSAHWSEDKSIGNIVLKYSTDLLKAYPPFVNFFEEMKEMLIQCDAMKPRFHAFLKACQTRPECGRQTLQDLLIRPVQRLPSISLLLNDILKNTPKNNSDHAALEQALAAIREVMTHINEDKRKTEGQKVMFDIFNDIDNCPPELLSSHRSFIAKSDVVQLSSSEGLSSKGNPLMLFLFSDQLEVCKKRSKAFNSLKSPNTVNGMYQKSAQKPYKHVRLMPLSTIRKVINIKETEDCQKVFTLIFKNNDDSKERLFSFAMTDEDANKPAFLKTLCRQMANNVCTPDADQFLAYLEPHQLDIDTSDVNGGTLSKAFKFATRTSLKVSRAFSFNKTPSKLKRAVSSMMSPFGSSTNLTPASQLAQMRLASYNNINELGNPMNAPESPPVAPMSVQPSRKLKSMTVGPLQHI